MFVAGLALLAGLQAPVQILVTTTVYALPADLTKPISGSTIVSDPKADAYLLSEKGWADTQRSLAERGVRVIVKPTVRTLSGQDCAITWTAKDESLRLELTPTLQGQAVSTAFDLSRTQNDETRPILHRTVVAAKDRSVAFVTKGEGGRYLVVLQPKVVDVENPVP